MFRIFRLLLALALCTLSATTSQATASTLLDASEDLEVFTEKLERRIARHRSLKALDFEWIWDYEDYVVLVQKPRNMQADYVQTSSKLASAPSLAMNTSFKKGFVEQHGIQLRSSSPRMPLIVLEDPREMEKFMGVLFGTTVRGIHAWYSEKDTLFVTCRSPYSSDPGRELALKQMSRVQRARQLVHSYSPHSEGMPGPLWFQLGLANEIAGLNDRTLTRKFLGKSSPWNFNVLCQVLKNSKSRRIGLPRLEPMLGFHNSRDVSRSAELRTRKLKINAPKDWYIQAQFQASAGALYHFLTEAADNDLQERMLKFTEAAMKGKLRQQPFESFFEDVDWQQVEHNFWSYVWDRWENEAGTAPEDQAPINSWLTDLYQEDGKSAGTKAQAPATALLDLAPGHDAQLALAMASVLSGDPEAAQARLQALLDAGLPEGPRARASKELLRVKAWTKERDGYLQYLVESGKKLVLKIENKKMIAKVTEIDRGDLILGSNNRDLKSIAIKDIDPIELIGLMNGRKSDFPTTWAMGYPAALTLGPKAKRYLKGDGSEVKELTSDLRAYRERKPEIEAAGHLLILADDPGLVGDPRDGLSRIEHLKAILQQTDRVDWLPALRPALRAVAAKELALEFHGKTIGELLNVSAQVSPSGVIELHYDFSDPEQLKDWILESPREDERGRWDPIDREDQYLKIVDGKLHGLGALSRRHVLSLSGPQVLRWETRIVSEGTASSDRAGSLLMALCANDEGSYAAVLDHGELEMMDGPTREFLHQAAVGYQSFFERVYKRELRHDGEDTIEAYSDGKKINEVPCTGRRDGQALIFIHTDYVIEIDNIILRGQVTEDAMNGYRDNWIKGQLLTLGFSD